MKLLPFVSLRTSQFCLALLVLIVPQSFALAADQMPQVRSASGFESERGSNLRRDTAELEQFPVEKKQPETMTGKHTATAAGFDCCGFYIYSARTELFDDLDRDGFFSYLRISLDIDTDYEEAELYIEVYMQGATGGWTHIYDSNVFTIYGNSGLDSYEVESELLTGFPTDYYDVLVEVYDAYTGELVVEYGPAEHDALSLLPMEEVLLDARSLPPTVISSGGGGGGSVSVSLLALLLLLSTWRTERRRNN